MRSGRTVSGKSGRGAGAKTRILVAVQRHGHKAEFIAMQAIHSVSAQNIRQFAKRHQLARQTTRTDGLVALRVLAETQRHEGRVTPPEQADEWLPYANRQHQKLLAQEKRVRQLEHLYMRWQVRRTVDELRGTHYCGLESPYFNRRFWESELPSRLLNACIDHVPVHLRALARI